MITYVKFNITGAQIVDSAKLVRIHQWIQWILRALLSTGPLSRYGSVVRELQFRSLELRYNHLADEFTRRRAMDNQLNTLISENAMLRAEAEDTRSLFIALRGRRTCSIMEGSVQPSSDGSVQPRSRSPRR